MDTIQEALLLVKRGCYLGSIDFKHVHFSVAIAQKFRKYLRFLWNGGKFQFTCLPQGLSPALRVFTKLLKPVFATLQGHGRAIQLWGTLITVQYCDSERILLRACKCVRR